MKDCTAALKLNLEGLESDSAALAPQSPGDKGNEAMSGRSGEGVVASARAAALTGPAEGPLREWVSTFEPPQDTTSTSGSSLSEASLKHDWSFGEAKAQQLCRVAVRRGAAHAHLKRFDKSVLDYESAHILARLGKDEAKAQQLEADILRLKGMALMKE